MQSQRSLLYYYTGSLLAALSFPFFLLYFIFLLPGSSDAMGAAFAESPIFLIGSLLFIFLTPIITTVYFKKHQQLTVQNYINMATIRYIVAFFMFFYGFSKMAGKFFEITYLTQDSRVADVDSFSLTWFYFGKSNVQEFIIGLLEAIPALLLLFRRTAFLGTLLLLPVSLNVLMINIFNHIAGLTLFVSFFIVLCNVYLLFAWKAELVMIFRKMGAITQPNTTRFINGVRITFKTIILITLSYFVLASVSSHLINKDHLHAGRNKIMGGFALDSLSVNGSPLIPNTNDTFFYRSVYLEPQSRWNTIRFTGNTAPHAITVQWHAKNDSVFTFLKTKNDVSETSVDSASKFSGTYNLVGNRLYVSGTQYGRSIYAIYVKKPLKDYKWFW